MSDDRPLEPCPAPVTIRDVAFVALVYFFWPNVVAALMLASGLGPGPLTPSPTAEQVAGLLRLKLRADGIAFPLQLASLPLLPRLTGVRLPQIGVTARRLGWNLLWGVVGWAALTPICFGVYFAVLTLYGSQEASGVHEHPFVRMAAEGLSPTEWALLVGNAAVFGPVMEELFFRGVLLAWLEPRRWASLAVMAAALLLALPWNENLTPLVQQRDWAVLLHLAPAGFMAALLAVYGGAARWLSGPAAAVFASSALFAAVHSFAWPSPVPLFVLALGLGGLARRTHSLAGPVVLHGLFNAVSCVLLFVK